MICPLITWCVQTGRSLRAFSVEHRLSYATLQRLVHRQTRNPRADTLRAIERATGDIVTVDAMWRWCSAASVAA